MRRFFDSAKTVAKTAGLVAGANATGLGMFAWLVKNDYVKLAPGQKVYFVPPQFQYLNLLEKRRVEQEQRLEQPTNVFRK